MPKTDLQRGRLVRVRLTAPPRTPAMCCQSNLWATDPVGWMGWMKQAGWHLEVKQIKVSGKLGYH